MEETAKEVRRQVLKMIHAAQTSHIGSNFSCIDILTVIHEIADFSKDKLVYSKGWAAAAAYVFLARRGVIPWEDLDTFCQPGSKYIGLLESDVPGIEAPGGSMGYGLPFGVGYALAKKLKGEDGRVFVLMSDGEQAIGTTWESALLAAHHHLDNLTVIVDYNTFQAMGKVSEVLNIEPLRAKWEAFGWDVWNIDGHSYEDIKSTLTHPLGHCDLDCLQPLPQVVIAHTTKGKGVSWMENKLDWHYKTPSDEDYEKALQELQ